MRCYRDIMRAAAWRLGFASPLVLLVSNHDARSRRVPQSEFVVAEQAMFFKHFFAP
jgi:hypothetical protein